MQRPNIFVQEESDALQVPMPDLPVFLTEHYGQCAEDVIVVALLRALQQRTGVDLSRERYLEIGGNHPIGTSATFLLHRTLGMMGIIVEANPRLIQNLMKGRPNDKIIHAAVHTGDSSTAHLSVSNANELSSLDRRFVLEWDQGRIGERELVEVPAIKINTLIEREYGGGAPLYLSIDIEGLDLDVLKDLDFSRFRPFVVQAEPSDHHLPDNSLNIQNFMESVGYSLIGKTNVNLLFVDICRIRNEQDEHSSTLQEQNINRLESDLEQSLQRNLQLEDQIEQLNQSVSAATEKYDQLNDSYAEIQRQLKQNEHNSALQEQNINRLESDLEQSLQRNLQLEQTIQDLLKSTSWVITAPLRAAGRPLARSRHLIETWRGTQVVSGKGSPSLVNLASKIAHIFLREGPAGVRLRATALRSTSRPHVPLEACAKAPTNNLQQELIASIDIGRHQIFFIDVFDTAVIRIWREPTDVFKYLAVIKKDANFAMRRIEREAKARSEFKSQCDITLDQIYIGLPADLDSEEINAELRFCVANPVFRPFYEQLIKEGKAVYFVSDMYLDKATVTQILKKSGYLQYEDVFVSSDDLLLKGDGSRFTWLKNKFPGCEQHALHIGDNPIADDAQPRAHGFSTYRLPSATEWFSSDDFIATKWPALQVEKSLGISSVLGLFRLWKSSISRVETPSYWRQFGFFYGGALISAFCGHIHTELKKHDLKVSRLFFLARDGDILSRVYQEFYEQPEAIYTLASRRCMSFPAIYDFSETDKEQLRLFTTPLGVSNASDIFERFGYTDLIDFENDLRLHESKYESWTDANILEIMQRHSDAILGKASAERTVLVDYLRNIGFFDESNAVIVDVGWSGSIQNALQKIIERESGGVPQLHGIYLGVNGEAMHKEKKYGYLFDRDHRSFSPYLNLIELLTASPRDGIIRIKKTGERFAQIPARRTNEEERRQHISKHIQRGILEFASLAKEHHGANLEFVSPIEFEKLFSTLLTHTSDVDAEKLGSIRHAMTIGNNFNQYVLTGK